MFKNGGQLTALEENVVAYLNHLGAIGFEPGYNDIGLYDTSSTALVILWYQLILHS
jgi:hypothetical protein